MLFLSSLLVPFQSFIIPIAKMANSMHINNTISGYIWIQVTLYAPMGIFMYQGFTKNVPISLEESARLDGANPVSYTHLDVYKRQGQAGIHRFFRFPSGCHQ